MAVRAGTLLQGYCGMGDDQLIVTLASTWHSTQAAEGEVPAGGIQWSQANIEWPLQCPKVVGSTSGGGCTQIVSEGHPYEEAISDTPCGSSVFMGLMRLALFGREPGGKMHRRLIFKRNGCHVVFFLQIRLPHCSTKRHPVSALFCAANN